MVGGGGQVQVLNRKMMILVTVMNKRVCFFKFYRKYAQDVKPGSGKGVTARNHKGSRAMLPIYHLDPISLRAYVEQNFIYFSSIRRPSLLPKRNSDRGVGRFCIRGTGNKLKII